jgi:hypothetical protein
MSTTPPGDLLPDKPIIRHLRAWTEAEDRDAQLAAGLAYCAEVEAITGDPLDGVRDLLTITRRTASIVRASMIATVAP